MRKGLIIAVIVGMLGYAIFTFISNDKQRTALSKGDGSANIGIEKGNIAPDFTLETLDGEEVKLSDYRGEKVMLNFWGTWCPPCRAEMPDMQKFYEDYDATILAVNLTQTENSPSNVTKFIEEYNIGFSVLKDVNTIVANVYQAKSLPTTYLINTKGEIHNIAVGPLNYEQMVQVFEEMD